MVGGTETVLVYFLCLDSNITRASRFGFWPRPRWITDPVNAVIWLVTRKGPGGLRIKGLARSTNSRRKVGNDALSWSGMESAVRRSSGSCSSDAANREQRREPKLSVLFSPLAIRSRSLAVWKKPRRGIITCLTYMTLYQLNMVSTRSRRDWISKVRRRSRCQWAVRVSKKRE